MKTDRKDAGRERRVYPRHEAKIDVNYKHGDTYLFSKTENLSELGIFLVSTTPFEKGTRLELTFRQPEGGEPIAVTGEVMWVEVEGTGRKPGVGIRFIDPNERLRRRIKALIRTVAYLE
ncbi:MAG: PilZ domain-containing protein [Proteobacteria bacterium]|nr:PilZ domain-containing protein [Pseudomonadota bacterium]